MSVVVVFFFKRGRACLPVLSWLLTLAAFGVEIIAIVEEIFATEGSYYLTIFYLFPLQLSLWLIHSDTISKYTPQNFRQLKSEMQKQ